MAANSNLDITNIFAFRQLITIPIEAVVDANISAAETSLRFIRKYGFEGDPSDPADWGNLRMISFTYNYFGNARQQEMQVSIPVLSLIPLPLLTINRAKFKMGIQIINQVLKPGEEVDGLPVDPVEKEVLTLLAPLSTSENTIDSNSVELAPTTQVTTNMDATIEVVSADLPQGIIKLLNLFQDATEGQSEDVFKITTSPQALYFSALDAEDEIIQKELTIDLRVQEESVQGQIVKIQVISSTQTPVNDTFATPIGILTGDLVGVPTVPEISARTNRNGKVKVRFTAWKNGSDNGFIKISTGKTDSISIYYNVNQQDPILFDPILKIES